MLEQYLVQTCHIVTMIRDEYSNYRESARTQENCRFREITTMRRNTHQEILDSDALIWLTAATTAIKGSIILFEGVYYQVERITRARKLDDAIVHFTKCELKITDVLVS